MSAASTQFSILKNLIPTNQYQLLKQFDKYSHKLQQLNCEVRFLKRCFNNSTIPYFIRKQFIKFKRINTQDTQILILKEK